jgi:hypothetical protein
MMKHDDVAEPENEAHMAADIEVSVGMVPIAHDGGPTPGYGQLGEPDSAPAFDAENCICMRDCRYYFETKAHFEHGNRGTYAAGSGPVQFKRACKAIPGVWLEISGDAPVLECNQWDPLSIHETGELDRRRAGYYALNPDHEPPEIVEDLDLGDEINDVVRDPDPDQEN